MKPEANNMFTFIFHFYFLSIQIFAVCKKKSLHVEIAPSNFISNFAVV